MTGQGPAKRPCGSCPYRRDVPSGIWHESEYTKLPNYDKETFDQPIGAFFCHQQDGHMCAGWVGTHDMQETMALRPGFRELNGLDKDDVQEALDYECPVPLFSSGQEAAEHGMEEIEEPSLKARTTADKIYRRTRGKKHEVTFG